MPKTFSLKLVVSEKSIDFLNHVNNVTYLEWAQNIAEKHWGEISSKDFNDKYVWVVLRHEIDYKSSAILGDELELKTWIGKSHGLKSIRYVYIYRQNKLICSVKTSWCLLNKNMKPIRIPDEILSILNLHQQV
ncbi:acyl-CoA thioesterase [Lutibacter citreus]|uniref:acyl-CoA thioesterase n=1 Tax=Lutibacter citreus TaxID=2138210 RepID=UPI000DBE2D6C|nr:thioesterase family protein [Lutibacter citreus]